MPKHWTQEEIDYLEKSWGNKSIGVMQRHLNKTFNAMRVKANRLGLEGFAIKSDNIMGCQVAKMLGITHHVIDRWRKNHGFPAKKKTFKKRSYWVIDEDDLIKWLKDNQDKWDTRKMELYALGKEPEWLKEKRQKDRSIAKRKYLPWTEQEDQRLIAMFKTGNYTQPKIAQILNRTSYAVASRLQKLDIWGTSKYKPYYTEKIIQKRKRGA